MRITLLSGGVGGARMARGFAGLEQVALTVVVNVGDDATVHGLSVCPDLDTVVYTLAGIEGPEGWGRQDETWNAMGELERFPTDTSFRLGDKDLALNLFRSGRLGAGAALSEVTAGVCRAFGVRPTVLPASDDPIRTMVQVQGDRWIDFQTYFVRRRHADRVMDVRFEGAGTARPAPGVTEAIRQADALVIAPSNPPLSVWPILAVPEIAGAVSAARRILAISPLIGGAALKGPAATVLRDLGHPPGNAGVVAAYGGLLTDLVVDDRDRADAGTLGPQVWVTDIRIAEAAAAARLATEVVAWLR